MTDTGLIETVESEVISATACGQTKMETSENQIDKTTPKGPFGHSFQKLLFKKM